MTVAVEKKQALTETLEKARGLMTLLNLHIAGAALLGLVNLYLLAHMFYAWRQVSNQDEAAVANQTVAMKAAEIAKKPLEGLDGKLVKATKDADLFYQKRLPFSDSAVAAELGALAKKEGVKWGRAQYAYSPVMVGTSGELTEARIDASLSGDYRPLVLFINALERDKMFFMIQTLTLTGEQAGTVGLRLKMTTYLRNPVGAERSAKNVVPSEASEDGAAAPVVRVAPTGPTAPAAGNGGRAR